MGPPSEGRPPAGPQAPVGLIAGNRDLPLTAARAVKARGSRLAVCAIRGEADPRLKDFADRFVELNLGELSRLTGFFLENGVKRLSMAGGISRESMLEHYDPDEEAAALMEGLPNYQTDTLLRGIAGYLESKGLSLISVAELVPEILVKPGQLGKTAPGPDLLKDLIMAFTIAKELGRLDVGQTVVVSDRITVALEGADGTDETIRRGARLSKRPCAAAKVMKPTQDPRLDLPVIGPPTMELLAEVKAGGLALDARGLIVLEQERCISLADEHNIVLVAWMEPPAFPS
jgi:DUF1009 family protein